MRMQRTLACAGAAGILALAAGCGSDSKRSDSTGAGGSTTGSDTQATPATGATVAFVTPKNGATTSSTVKVKVKTTHFVIDPKAVGKSPVPGRGHLHFALDGGKFDHPKYSGKNGKLAQGLGVDGKYSPSLTPSITYSNLPAGKHELEVYLANNNHTDTGVESKVEFTVK
ncbi:MAG: hypothetical protein QOJ07_1698 [Thermoleophilaceae bacterium]|nr:hypothetical protein [Thermoleophilaceae bacterium]